MKIAGQQRTLEPLKKKKTNYVNFRNKKKIKGH